LDSGQGPPPLSRYSYLGADPFAWFGLTKDAPQPLAQLGAAVRRFAAPVASRRADLPPFQGGAVLMASYDLNLELERVVRPCYEPFAMPRLAFGLYDVVVALDHQLGRGWLISQGLPAGDERARCERASEREHEFLDWLAEPEPAETHASEMVDPGHGPPRRLDVPQFPTWGPPELTSNFTKENYLKAVEEAVEFVRAGDIFQVNLAQTLMHPAAEPSRDFYCRLRAANPAPFAAYFDLGSCQVMSASPERFLRVVEQRVEARPIKGTRPRRAWPEADLFAAFDLQTSAKDRAENVMIVDLMRNDLARVCEPASIVVTQLCELESYAFVQHLVSAVEGRLPDTMPLERLLAATFPGGSVTGAPKIRAMQIISQLEATHRGPYCGSMGYWSFDGALDLNILIRTVTAVDGWWVLPVGGGIVADSDPQREYEETWHKATGLLRPILQETVSAGTRSRT
jgi:para-aminobenzoate synthetase component 1